MGRHYHAERVLTIEDHTGDPIDVILPRMLAEFALQLEGLKLIDVIEADFANGRLEVLVQDGGPLASKVRVIIEAAERAPLQLTP